MVFLPAVRVQAGSPAERIILGLQPDGKHRFAGGKIMKKLLLALILGIIVLPASAMAQKWVEPYYRKDGAHVDGHWENPEASWKRSYSQPGVTNPFTGQFNTYGNRNYRIDPNYQMPARVPASKAANPSGVPGSSAPNPYAIPGSSPNPKVPK